MYWLPEVRGPIMFCNKFKCGLQETKEFILEKEWIFTLQHQHAHTCTCIRTCTNTDLWKNPKISINSSKKPCVILIQEKILGHVGVRLFKGFPKMSKC